MSQPLILKKPKVNGSVKTYKIFRTNPPPKKKKEKENVLFITGDWNTKVGSQEISGITGKFGLRVQNKAGQS